MSGSVYSTRVWAWRAAATSFLQMDAGAAADAQAWIRCPIDCPVSVADVDEAPRPIFLHSRRSLGRGEGARSRIVVLFGH